MKLSEDIIIYKNKDYSRVYNKFTNQMIELDNVLMDYLFKCQESKDFKNIYSELSNKQIELLVKNGILIEDIKAYKKKKFVSQELTKDNKINTVYFHVTYKCNLKCEYCYQNIYAKDHNMIDSTKDWKKILRKLKFYDVKKIVITGGEPLLHPQIDQILKFAKSLGYEIDLLTNGSLIREKCDILNYADAIVMSLDGIESGLRKGLSISTIMENIKLVKERYTGIFKVRSVVSSGHEVASKRLGNYLQSIGIEQIETLRMPNNIKEINLMPDYRKFKLEDYESLNAGCGAADSVIAIDPLGDVYPCQLLMNEELRIGNILDDKFKELYLKGEIYNKIHSFDVYQDEECKHCELIHYCSGGCPANSYKIYGNFSNRNDFMCDFYKYTWRCLHEKC
ncbi:radical SAM protein [Lagierella sp.]|uniref:radical SAM/SPASM domain-containing protein n=1 Tax=Lagierella sp. TaxID=2849657 RepID=UPI00261F5254|nr:radical SAM protein [Lagierella sp.]